MVKNKKQRLRKKYQYKNNKALKKRKFKQPRPQCKIIGKNIDKNLPLTKNLKKMGLALDPNQVLKIESFTKTKHKEVLPYLPKDVKAPSVIDKKNKNKKKSTVVNALENACKAKKKRQRENHVLKLPNEMCKWLMYLIDKYGEDDYEAMARDKENIYQHTAAQIRGQILRFKRTTYQFPLYMQVKAQEEKVQQESMDI